MPLRRKPDLIGVEGLRLHAKAQLCDWSNFEDESAHLISAVRNGKPNTGPFQFLAVPSSPEDQLQCAKLWAATHFPPAASPLWHGERYDHDRLRVAYLSADFRQHPVAMCMAGVIECHDKSLFEITALSCGPDDNSDIRRRLQASFERFIDAQTYSDEQIASLVKELEIDILVDLMGYTTDSRTGVLARRPCADPGELFRLLRNHGGRLYRLPYRRPDDHSATISASSIRKILSTCPTASCRAITSAHIRQKIFTCRRWPAGQRLRLLLLQQSLQDLPDVFDSWMRILSHVEGSVLWLLETNATAESNLRQGGGCERRRPAAAGFRRANASRRPSGKASTC